MDQAMNYNSILLKVEKTIAKLKNIGLNVIEFENRKTEIINNCQREVENSYQYQSSVSLNQSAFLEQIYINASFELNKLLVTMMQYEIYLKIASFTNSLKIFLSKKEKNTKDFDELRTSLVALLTKLVNSNTLDYRIEEPLITDIYLITYNFIKEEIKATGDSLTLKLLSDNEIHLINIDVMVRKELETMNLQDSKYTLINSILNKLDAIGIEANYANLELIKEIVYSNVSLEECLSLIVKLEEKVKDYLKEASDLRISVLESRENLKRYPQNRKETYIKLTKFIASLGLSTSIIVSLILASFKIGKDAGIIKKNLTRYTIYNASNDKTSITLVYEQNPRIGVYLKEYSPFTQHGNFYTRTVSTYDLSNIKSIPIKEYLDIDLSRLGIRENKEIEEKNSLNSEDFYEEDYKTIEKIELSENDFVVTKDLFNQIPVTIISLFMSIVIYKFYNLLFNYMFIDNPGDYEKGVLAYSLSNIRELLNDLKITKELEESEIKKLKQNETKLTELIKENKELILALEEKIKLLNDEPTYEDQRNSLKRALTKIKNTML